MTGSTGAPPLRVLFVSGMPLGSAPCRYRCVHLAEALRAGGARADIVYIGQPRVRVAHDIVVLYRVCATAEGRCFARAARACGAALVYSTDDLVFDANYAPPQMGKRFRALAPLHREMLAEADAAIASTDYLADQMRVIAPKTPVYTLRNFLGADLTQLGETAHDFRKSHDETNRVTISYLSGSPTHDDDFAVVAQPLRRVLEANEHAELLLVGPVALPESLVDRDAAGQVRRMPSVVWENLPALVAEQGISINLAPLDLSQPFCHAKSEVKFLEAASLGITTIASASKGFQEVIPNPDGNEGCFLAATSADWELFMGYLVQNKTERADKGERAYRYARAIGTAAANKAAVTSVFNILAWLRKPDRMSVCAEKIVNWPFSPRYALKEAWERGMRLRTAFTHRPKRVVSSLHDAPLTVVTESAEKPRILYVATVDIMLRLMLPQLDALRDAGFTVEIACRLTRHGETMAAHADLVHDLPFHRSPMHPQNLQALSRLTRLIRNRRYVIVHAHTPVGGVAGRVAATLGNAPIRMYTAHGFHFHRHGSRLGNALYRTVETVAGRRFSDAVLVINGEDYEAARLHKFVTKPERLFLTGGVGISTDQFSPSRCTEEERMAIRREIGAESDAVPVLTFVGEMIPRKRHADLLDSFTRIRAVRPDAILVLAGDGVFMEKVQKRAREKGVEDGCRFLGYRRDIPAILAATDLFVFPSSQEGLPCAIQEALSMEVPTVATDVRGNRDLVRSDCGRLVPLADTDALASACLELLALPPEKRRDMGRAGRARMVADYERGACVAQWMRIYARLLTQKGIALPPGMVKNEAAAGVSMNAPPLRPQSSRDYEAAPS